MRDRQRGENEEPGDASPRILYESNHGTLRCTLLNVSLLSALLLLGSSVYAQTNAPAPYTIQTSARLVVLDVVVTDKQGNVVPGLKREDFHIAEAGTPQTIVSFDGLGAHIPPANVDIESTADLASLAPQSPVNIIVVDEFNTLYEDMAYARSSLKAYLNAQPGKLREPTTLIAANISKNVVLEDYTEDKSKIFAALDHHLGQYPWQASNDQWIGERYIRSFRALEEIARANLPHRGHKNVIWIGGGFPKLAGGMDGDTRNQLNDVVERCINMLRDARITLYAVDPRGDPFTVFQTGSDPTSLANGATAAADPFGGNLDFARMAVATGGRSLRGRNDVDAEIGTAARDGASLYTIAYRPTDASTDAKRFRSIKVSLVPPGLTATTREGYYPESNQQATVRDVVAADLSRTSYDGFPMKVTPAGTPDAYTVHIDLPDSSWIADSETGPRHVDLLVLASTFNARGEELKRTIKTFRVIQGKSGARDVDEQIALDHPAGAVRARFVVRVEQSGQIGSADVSLQRGPS